MITILCAGSRGDFQPYIALAQQLKVLGQRVRIAGSQSFQSFVQAYGLEFFPIKADLESLNIDPKLLQAAASSDNPLKMLLTFNKMKEFGVFTVQDYFEACQGSRLVVYHPGCAVGYFAAEQLGIPSVLASPFPMHRTREYLSLIMYGRVRSTRLAKKLSHELIQSMLWLASANSIKTFWKRQFGRLPANFGRPFENRLDHRHPALVACSNHVFPRPSDWNCHIHQYGYWFVEENEAHAPPAEVASFLEDGEIPVYIGFGSMTGLAGSQGLAELAVEALRKSGKRGIICGLGRPERLPKDIIAIDNIAHSWLFGRVSAVCHHGGAGTSAAGFRAGVPSIIVPFSNDQFAWAHRAYDLGVGPKPVYRKRLSADSLAEAIQLTSNDRMRENALALGRKISSENGSLDCARVIVNCLADGQT